MQECTNGRGNEEKKKEVSEKNKTTKEKEKEKIKKVREQRGRRGVQRDKRGERRKKRTKAGFLPQVSRTCELDSLTPTPGHLAKFIK